MPRLIDAEKLWKSITTRIEEYCDIADLIEIIETQPTVDGEPVRHGRWTTKYLSADEDWNGIEHTIGRCSVCGGKIDITGERIPYLYCPFCGAKMDEPIDTPIDT